MVCRAHPLKATKKSLSRDGGLLYLPLVLSMSGLDVPEMDTGCAIVPETLLLSFMLLLLLPVKTIPGTPFLLLFFVWMPLKRSFKSVDLLMYSAFAAMDQNQELCR
uniref:Bce-1 protein n=1 Tax=Mus musculus TaxID=10090 RepID=Q9WUL2_MOUSE|nr:Bce-1 protein [Mus musculus]